MKYEIHAQNGAGEKFVLGREKVEFVPLARRAAPRFQADRVEDALPYLQAVKARGAVSGIYAAEMVPVQS